MNAEDFTPYNEWWQEKRREFVEERKGIWKSQVDLQAKMKAYTALVDRVLQEIYAEALKRHGNTVLNLALVASGSYGREAMVDASDIDIRYVTRDADARGEWLSFINNAINDILKASPINTTVTGLINMKTTDENELSKLTNYLDMRLVAGGQKVFDRNQRNFRIQFEGGFAYLFYSLSSTLLSFFRFIKSFKKLFGKEYRDIKIQFRDFLNEIYLFLRASLHLFKGQKRVLALSLLNTWNIRYQKSGALEGLNDREPFIKETKEGIAGIRAWNYVEWMAKAYTGDFKDPFKSAIAENLLRESENRLAQEAFEFLHLVRDAIYESIDRQENKKGSADRLTFDVQAAVAARCSQWRGSPCWARRTARPHRRSLYSGRCGRRDSPSGRTSTWRCSGTWGRCTTTAFRKCFRYRN